MTHGKITYIGNLSSKLLHLNLPLVKRINLLIKDIQRSPYDGVGKPEPLKDNLSGMWSRRIDETNRIVYYEKYESIIIVACRGHYDE